MVRGVFGEYKSVRIFGCCLVVCSVVLMPLVASANVASAQYVNEAMANKVDTGQVTQTLQGSYTITGAIKVPTPALPVAD